MATISNANVRVSEAELQEKSVQGTASGMKCPHCSGAVAPDDEVCPHCGARLVDWCTFCGTPLLPLDDECPECGMPVSGVKCPQCGTLNQRPFCSKCNQPLTRAATKAVEKAKEDPVFQQCQTLAKKAAETTDEQEKKRIVTSLNGLFKRMLPPPGSTPKEQMIFYSARKVAVETTYVTRHRVGWVCNYCGCTHDKPSECAKPQLGGHWIYEDTKTTYTTYE